MRRKVCICLSAIIVLATLLSGCGQVTGRCESCFNNRPLYKVEYSSFYNLYCNDCIEWGHLRSNSEVKSITEFNGKY